MLSPSKALQQEADGRSTVELLASPMSMLTGISSSRKKCSRRGEEAEGLLGVL